MITNSTFTLYLKFGLSFRFFSEIRVYFSPIWQSGSFLHIIILNTNKIQEKICAEILYMRDYRLDFFQILNGV